MFRKDYYCLIAGLREYSLDAEKKGFDAPAIIAEIKEELSARDRRTVELFYTYYDIENIVSLRAGREHFSALGNLSREELQEELHAMFFPCCRSLAERLHLLVKSARILLENI